MKLLRRIDYWLHRRQRDAELAEELEFHRAQTGAPALGNATIAREDARAIWIWPWIESVFQDVRYALRNLRKQPGFALVALITLGAAIGLNTSLFTVFNAIWLRAWPVNDPSHVVKIVAQERKTGRYHGLPVAEYRFFGEHAKSFSGVVSAFEGPVRLGFEPFGKSSEAIFVSANYFQTLGVQLHRGRGFLPEEDQLDAPENVAVLSFRLWRDHFGRDPEILGKRIHVDDVPFTVVGVASEGFTGIQPGPEDLWIPMSAEQSLRLDHEPVRAFLTKPGNCCTLIAGRLAPGVSTSQAAAELELLNRRFEEQFKRDPVAVSLVPPTMVAGENVQENAGPVFMLMFAATTLVLLLASANVSNLLLARAAARRQEIEVRRSIGAGRARIVRQLLTEGMVLAAGAAILGVALALKLPAFLLARIGADLGVRLSPNLDVIVYATLLAMLSCVAFALAPALHGTRPRTRRTRLPLRSVLIGAQVAMSVVLLIGAGLMLAGITHARQHDLGYRIAGVQTISFELPASAYDSKRMQAFYEQLSRELENVPDLRAAGVTARAPLADAHWSTAIRLPGEAASQSHDIEFEEVSAGYFDVLGIPVLHGRNFIPGDDARHAIIVNQAMTRKFLHDDPIGKSIFIGKQSWEIVGVVRDAYVTDLDEVPPLLFEPFRGLDAPMLLVSSNATGAAGLVGGIARQIEKRARVAAQPLSANLEQALAPSRVGAEIAGLLGIFALALAAIGMAGVFAYVVQQRTKEIGIRMALGAEPKQVIRLVLAGTARAAIIGLAIGYLAAGGVAKLLAQYLYGVSPYDPRAYFGVALILIFSGFAAAYLPARRATRIDPLNALRVE